MINITHKSNTLRTAIAQAIVKVSAQETIDAIVNKKVAKGDVFEMAKTAGLFAAKRTSDMIPDCHPLPIEFTSVAYEINNLEIKIHAEIHTIYKTGVEVEAMHCASVVALTMYDMLKPIDKGIEILQIKLLDKKGGKSNHITDASNLKVAVIVCSDSISAGEKEDRSGKVIRAKMEGYQVKIHDYTIIADDKETIQQYVRKYHDASCDLIIITGGTGVSPKDITPEAVKPLLDKEIPGIAEVIRSYGQQRMPYSMLSRSIAGFMGESLIMALPGSTKGSSESIDAVFPAIFHLFKVRKFFKHDEAS